MATEDLTAIRAAAPVVAAEGDLVYVVRGGVRKGALAEEIAIINQHKYNDQTLDTTTAYELVITDAGGIVEMANAGACTLTIPANAAVAFDVDTRIDLVQGGAGLMSVVITSDTLNGEVVSFGQWKRMQLWKRSTTVWVIFGGTT